MRHNLGNGLSAWRRLWRTVWGPTPCLTRVLLGLQLVMIPALLAGDDNWAGLDRLFPLRVFLTLISLRCLGLLVVSLTPNWVGVRSCAPIAVMMVYLGLGFYHQHSSVPLGWDLVQDHCREWLTPGALAMVADRLAPWQWTVCALIYLALVIVEGLRGAFAADVQVKPNWTRSAGCALLYGLLAVLPVSSFDEVNLLLRNLRTRARPIAVDRSGPHPYLSWRERQGSSQVRPHVFLLMIESFNASFVERVSPTGQEYTPYFNSLIPRGVYVERFYGNSVYTVKGQAATLGSLLPSLRGSVARNYPALRLRALPQLLRDSGYATWFVQAAPELSFHDTGQFMRQLGFERVEAMHPNSLSEADKSHQWGWGLQDDRFYRNVFDRLDAAQAAPGLKRPWFVTLATISSHSPFDLLPAGQRRLYPDASTKREHYANTIHAVDGYLREFFAQLRARDYLTNSIVILVGDHGHPLGEHGHYLAETSCYEENFRTPFLLLWEGRLQPRRIAGRACSQLDVAPTVLELLDWEGWHHCRGKSILAEPGGDSVALLVQPYGGGLVAAVRYPFKYVLHLSRNEERLFNLEVDPKEKTNLRGTRIDEVAALREQVSGVFLNERLLDENRVWPKEERHKRRRGRRAHPLRPQPDSLRDPRGLLF